MLLAVAGALLVAMGLACGAALVLAPLALVPLSPGPGAWVLFPLLSVIGYVLCIVSSNAAQVARVSLTLSALMLLLGVCAAAGLLFAALGLLVIDGTLALWYVLAIAGVLGTLGVASHRVSTA